MSIDPNLLIAAKLIHDECVNNSFSCVGCQLQDICEHTSMPDEWRILEPPPEPTKRQRIEWLRMLPDVEMLNTAVRMNKTFDCKDCNIHSDCSPCTGNECNVGHMKWWHEVVSLEQFRKDVGLE
jgi:hypothetical protein